MDKKITVPTSWDDISLRNFYKLIDISNDEGLNIAQREIKIAALLTGLSIKEIRDIDPVSYQELTDKLAFLSSKIENKFVPNKLRVGDRDFIIDAYPNKWTAGQFLDYKTTYLSENSDTCDKICSLIACFVHPDGTKYNDDTYDTEDVAEYLKDNLSASWGSSLANFFSIQYQAYADAFLQSLGLKVKFSREIPRQEKKKIQEALKQARALIKSTGQL